LVFAVPRAVSFVFEMLVFAVPELAAFVFMAPRVVSFVFEALVPVVPGPVAWESQPFVFAVPGVDGPGAGVLVFAEPGPARSGGWAATKEPGVGLAETPGDGDGGAGWPSAGARLEAGGPGFGRFRSGAGRRASERLRWGTLMSATHAGRRT
jgi:hypothetical protein